MRATQLILFWVLFRSSLPAQMQITSITSSPASCSTNGSVTVMVAGGTPVYCYQINNGSCLFSAASTFTFTDLTPGIKNITVTDGPNTATVTATIEVTGSYQVPSLFGLAQGCGVYAQASGGLPPYQYAISLAGGTYSALQNDPQFTPVLGNYCLRVYDGCNNFTEYCGIIDISPVEFTAACCNSIATPNDICVEFTDRQGLHANDPGYWFGGQPPYTYNAIATGLTVNSPDGTFQLQQLCPGWTFMITDACGNTATQVPNCMHTEVLCVDCAAGTAEISTTNGVAPYVYYYQDAAGQWQPNPAGGTIGSFSGLPASGAGDSYTFMAIDACGNQSPPLEVNCLDAKGSFDCAVQTAYIEPMTDFFPTDITCQTCPAMPVITLLQPGLASFPVNVSMSNTFLVSDACGGSVTIICHDTLPDLSIEKSCNTIAAKMRSNYVCNGGELNPYAIESGVLYELALAGQPGTVIATNNTGVFNNLITGETYIVTATHGICGVATASVTLFTNNDFILKAELRTTSFIVNGVCQTGYEVIASLSPEPVLIPVFDLTGSTMFSDTSGIFPGISPGAWTLSAGNYCLTEDLILPDWKPEMSVQMPECPNGGCVQMSGARTVAEWISWGAGYGLNIVSNSDFYILDCPGFNGPQCVANWGGNICNLIPGNSYSVYLKPGTFTCPVDTISFIVDPMGTARIDSVFLTTPVTCTDTSYASLLLTAYGGKTPLYLEVIDSITGQVLRVIDDADNDQQMIVDSLEALKTYFFRVVDACNNTKDGSATVILLPNVTADYKRNCQGTITLKTAAILNAVYTWRDNTGAIIASGSNLWSLETIALSNAVDYSVEIHFGDCETHITGVTVPGFVPPDISLPFADTLFCNGFTLDLAADTGPGAYTFLWSTGETTSAITISGSGIYTVTGTDSFGCSDSAAANIAYSPAMVINSTLTHVDCFGNASGAANISVSGGTPAFDYMWENGATTSGRFGLTAGPYSVTVTDTQQCTATGTLNITEPPQLIVAVSATATSCYQGTDGTAQVVGGGGTSPYTFIWNNGFTGDSIAGLQQGNYTVTCTDAQSCQTTGTVTVNQPLPLTADYALININCFGESNGSITATATGGTGNSTYAWSVPGGVNGLLQNLAAGDYFLTVTDQNACTFTDTLSLIQPAPISATITGVNVRCAGGSDGSLSASASGGNGGWSYQWNSGHTGASVTDLPAGTYTVTVTDNNGCMATASEILTAPTPLTATTTTTFASCHNIADGSATVTAAGGISPYQFEWNPGGLTTPTIQQLSPGVYTVTMTDNQQCTATATATVIAPEQLVLNFTFNPVKCFGDASGTISVVVTGGTTSYLYNWSNNETTAAIQNLPPGNYTLTVTDQHNCTEDLSVAITQPQSLQIDSIHTTGAGCTINAGTATVAVSGGSMPYSASWNNGQTGLSVQNLVSGTYTVTVTDAKGCTTVSSAVIAGIEPLTVEISTENVSCFGETDGAVIFETVKGGSGPPYYINGAILNTEMPIGNLAAGSYTWTISDGSSCSEIITAIIIQPPPFSFSLPDIIQIDLGEQILLKPQLSGSPAPPVTWQWTPSTGLSCDSCASTLALPFQTTQYQLLATDANGCSASGVVRIFVDRNCGVYVANIFTPLMSGPNDLLVVNAEPCVKRVVRWQIFDRWGGMMYSQKDFLPNDFKYAWDGTSRNKQVEAGVYSWYAQYELIDGTEVLIIGDVTVVY